MPSLLFQVSGDKDGTLVNLESTVNRSRMRMKMPEGESF